MSKEAVPTTIEALLELLDHTGISSLQAELRKLHEIKDWALANLGIDYGVGDRVKIVHAVDTDNGWATSSEALAVGQTAVVQSIDFGPRGWYALIKLDQSWSTSPVLNRRYWHGRAEDIPHGFVPPSAFDQERYPDGRRKSYYFKICWLARADYMSTPPVFETEAAA